jgi:hypothetical protein
VGGKEEHLVNGIESDHGHGEPAGQLVTRQDPGRREELERSKNERDPAPGAQPRASVRCPPVLADLNAADVIWSPGLPFLNR